MRVKIMRILFLFILVMLSACSTNSQLAKNQNNDEDIKALQLVEKSDFDEMYLDVSINNHGYTAIHYKPLDFSELIIDERRLEIRQRPWRLSDSDIQRSQKGWQSVLQDFYKKDRGFVMVSDDAEKSLQVEVLLERFVPTASKDDPAVRGPREKVFSRSVGALHMKTIVRDPVSQKILAVFKDKQEVGDSFRLERNDRINNEREIKHTLRKWVREIDNTLASI